jgi:hypothetical protein
MGVCWAMFVNNGTNISICMPQTEALWVVEINLAERKLSIRYCYQNDKSNAVLYH